MFNLLIFVCVGMFVCLYMCRGGMYAHVVCLYRPEADVMRPSQLLTTFSFLNSQQFGY